MAAARGKGDMGNGRGGHEGKGEATKAARVVMAREAKRERAKAAISGNGSYLVIGVIVMAVAAFDGGGGDCNLF
jgi:hypothetical protein